MFEKFILQIWSASPIPDINTSAPIYWRWHVISANTIALEKEQLFKKFATLCLVVKTSPFNFAGISGNGNKKFYRALTLCSNSKQLSIATVLQADDRWYSLLPNPPLFSLLSTFSASTIDLLYKYWQFIWIIYIDLLPSETFSGNFCVCVC
jgi:hypothetical protein